MRGVDSYRAGDSRGAKPGGNDAGEENFGGCSDVRVHTCQGYAIKLAN